MSETPKTVFVTKYALTDGIKELAVTRERINGYLYLEGYPHSAFSPNEYSLSRTEAIARADIMKAEKLASLRKQIAKLEAMTFA